MMKENESTADPNTAGGAVCGLCGANMSTTETTHSDVQPHKYPDKVGEIGGRVTLTSRELRLLELVSYGYANADIAGHFQITQQAVKNMLRSIHLKLGADNRAHAVSICFRNGWLRTDSSGGPESQKSFTFRTSPRLPFTRRWNCDGTIDSVCNACRLVIGRAWTPDDLAAAESRHVCQVLERRRSIRMVSQNGAPADVSGVE